MRKGHSKINIRLSLTYLIFFKILQYCFNLNSLGNIRNTSAARAHCIPVYCTHSHTAIIVLLYFALTLSMNVGSSSTRTQLATVERCASVVKFACFFAIVVLYLLALLRIVSRFCYCLRAILKEFYTFVYKFLAPYILTTAIFLILFTVACTYPFEHTRSFDYIYLTPMILIFYYHFNTFYEIIFLSLGEASNQCVYFYKRSDFYILRNIAFYQSRNSRPSMLDTIITLHFFIHKPIVLCTFSCLHKLVQSIYADMVCYTFILSIFNVKINHQYVLYFTALLLINNFTDLAHYIYFVLAYNISSDTQSLYFCLLSSYILNYPHFYKNINKRYVDIA